MSARRGDRRRGAGLVEFALCATIFMALVFGVCSGAWYVAASSAAGNAAREAARYGAATANTCSSAAVRSAALAQMGSFSGATVTAVAGEDADGAYCAVTVQVPYRPFAGVWPFASTTITSSAQEYAE